MTPVPAPRHRLIAAGLALAGLLAATGAAAQTIPPGPKITISAVTQVAPTLPQYTRIDQPLLRDGLAQKSGGRIEVNLASWPERNVNGPEVLRLVRSGQVDIAAGPLTTVSGDVPMLDGIDLAGMNLDIRQARRVADAMLPVANRELERLGIKLIATYPFENSLAALQPGAPGQPVSVAFGEVSTALERGTVDCGITGSGSGNGVKWPEVSTHLFTLPLSWSTAGYYVNLAWWNKLEAPVRALIEKTFADIQEQQWALGLAATQDGIDCNVGRAEGCKIHTLVKRPMVEVKPQGDVAATIRKEMIEDVLPAWVKRCGDRCGTVYNEVIAPITGIRHGAR